MGCCSQHLRVRSCRSTSSVGPSWSCFRMCSIAETYSPCLHTIDAFRFVVGHMSYHRSTMAGFGLPCLLLHPISDEEIGNCKTEAAHTVEASIITSL